MKLREVFLFLFLLALVKLAKGASPGNAPALPITGVRVVNVATEAQLQTAMGNLRSGDTILLADGTYNLTSTLYINGRSQRILSGENVAVTVIF